MLYYQTKWGEQQKVGMYWGLGAKVQLPIIYSKYHVANGSQLTAQGYYPGPDLTLDGSGGDISHHGFGTTDKPGFKNDLDLKISIAGTLEMGFLVALNRRVDLTIGGYFDYGFNNIKDGNKSDNRNLIEPTHPSGNPAESADPATIGKTYNGIINSHVTDKVNLLAAGGKVGLRIKLGKLTEKKVEEEEKDELIVVQEVIKEPEPVVEVKPVVTEDQGIGQSDLYILSEPIFFDLAKHDLRFDAIQILDRKVAILKKYPDVKVVIAGNTCDLGGDKINIPLGQRRADAACDYLEKNGIDRSRMETVTQASNYPMLPNTNEQNRTKNRRDDFKPSGY